jgi:hypothetical protein
MTRTTRIPIVVTSNVQAAVNGDPIHVCGNKMAFQVVAANAVALVELEGSLDGTNWVDLNYDNVAAAYTLTVMNTLGAGYYEVFERPEYVRMVVDTDAGGPRDFYAVLIVKKESD